MFWNTAAEGIVTQVQPRQVGHARGEVVGKLTHKAVRVKIQVLHGGQAVRSKDCVDVATERVVVDRKLSKHRKRSYFYRNTSFHQIVAHVQ